MTGILSRNAGAVAGFIERYVLSFVYLFFAWTEFHDLAILSLDSRVFDGIPFIPAVKHMTLMLLQLFIGVFLMFNKRPAGQPRNLREVFVPLAASFFFLTYNALPHFPPSFRENLLPREMHTSFATVALVLGVAGPAISVWGVLSLGRSFGIFVSVREIVMEGPYRYVRHPIYLGYVCIWTALLLLNVSMAIFIIVPIHLLLFVWRARLEESRLAESSAAYREYMKQTGFIFPRLRGGAKVEAQVPKDR